MVVFLKLEDCAALYMKNKMLTFLTSATGRRLTGVQSMADLNLGPLKSISWQEGEFHLLTVTSNKSFLQVNMSLLLTQ